MFKNKLNNYFIAEILRSYAFVLASLSFLIWITQSARFLYLITDMGLSMSVYVPYILYQLPKIVSQMMLISFLISLFISIIKFQNNKEMEIYWLSGISKKTIVWTILKISLVPTFIAFFLYIYLAPMTGLISRNILANSEFTFVNALVKKNNFNSPFQNLTVYVGENDNRGNLKKVYLFENNKTIIAKQGKVLNLDNKNYLQLIDGFIHEKNKDNKVQIIKFSKFNQIDDATHLHGLSLGYEDDNKIEIYINEESWDKFSKPNRYFLMYHELAHDVLNLDDLDPTEENEGRLMYPNISSYDRKNMDDFIESYKNEFENISN